MIHCMSHSIKKRQITPEPVEEETSFFNSSADSEIVAPKSSTPTSLREDEEEEEEDEFDGDTTVYSFSKFSNLHFQGNATHRHITQRLRQPLLPHDDEGDALVRGRPARLSSSCHLQRLLSHKLLSSRSPPGLSDRVVDHPAIHGGPAGAKASGYSLSNVQHFLPSAASQARQEAEPPGGT